uniref:Uncharacterized protein n=1 Tax=Cannabis sativa TaxID=3483 RepID=A0A803Q2T2_CANSA
MVSPSYSSGFGVLLFYSDLFGKSFWPQAFGTDAIASFFAEFLGYVCKAAESSLNFATEIAELTDDCCSFGYRGEVQGGLLTVHI